MIEKMKKAFSLLDLEYCPVAVKFRFDRPKDVPRTDETLSFCQFLKKAQTEKRRFYTTQEDDNCCGKLPLGMVPREGFPVSGIVGVDFEVFRSPAPNVRVHNSYPVLNPGTVRYVEFCPVELCDFYPDLVLFTADVYHAEILMRASSYISGDLWESKTSSIMSCAWTYVYPYMSGKINFCITGMHHGMRRRKVYPAGLHIISIPYQKLDEVVTALLEMPKDTIAMRDDESSRKELQSRMDHWKEIELAEASSSSRKTAGE